MLLLKYLTAWRVLIGADGALFLLSLALFGPASVSMIAFPLSACFFGHVAHSYFAGS